MWMLWRVRYHAVWDTMPCGIHLRLVCTACDMRLGVGTPCGYEHCVVWPSVQGVAMDEMVNWIMTNEFSRTTYRCTTSLQHAVAPGLQLVVRTGLRDVTRTGSRATCCRLDALHHFGRISKEQHTKWNHSHAGIGRSGRSRIYLQSHARTHARRQARTHARTREARIRTIHITR